LIGFSSIIDDGGRKMDVIEEFFKKVVELLEEVKKDQKNKIEEAAKLVKEALKADKLIHIYGCGHSQILAQEVFYRAGGLVPIDAMLDLGTSLYTGALKSTSAERLPGYEKLLLDYYDIKEGDVLIIVSNSGRNPVPVGLAIEAKKRGAKVIALTSVEFSSKFKSRHPSGKRLFEVADLVIDNKVPPGDAVLDVPGIRTKVAPVSTIINSAILHSMLSLAAKMLADEGVEPPVWMSANVEGGDEFNRRYIAKYKYRIKAL